MAVDVYASVVDVCLCSCPLCVLFIINNYNLVVFMHSPNLVYFYNHIFVYTLNKMNNVSKPKL